jgi:ABC-type lipoprotein export system ATPase subunit
VSPKKRDDNPRNSPAASSSARDFNVTIVMATHSQEAAQRCDQRIILSDGKIVSIEDVA